MRLVKDIDKKGIFFYWSNPYSSDVRISPRLPCIELAKEWRDKHLFSLYKGDERRRSHIDRRLDKTKRKQVDKALFYYRQRPEGRRSTDKPLTVDIDLVADKVQLYS
ncbi:hypothetical protein ACMXYW_10015 [Neptuniibacter sp. QD48_55]|uniref:hypothetical protein n=1 Tax=Neptuniibacter sp. QD48_55 TaxID=3398212 RepID=UPI0039F59331